VILHEAMSTAQQRRRALGDLTNLQLPTCFDDSKHASTNLSDTSAVISASSPPSPTPTSEAPAILTTTMDAVQLTSPNSRAVGLLLRALFLKDDRDDSGESEELDEVEFEQLHGGHCNVRNAKEKLD